MIISASKSYEIPTGLPDSKKLTDIQEPAVIPDTAEDLAGATPDTAKATGTKAGKKKS